MPLWTHQISLKNVPRNAIFGSLKNYSVFSNYPPKYSMWYVPKNSIILCFYFQHMKVLIYSHICEHMTLSFWLNVKCHLVVLFCFLLNTMWLGKFTYLYWPLSSLFSVCLNFSLADTIDHLPPSYSSLLYQLIFILFYIPIYSFKLISYFPLRFLANRM